MKYQFRAEMTFTRETCEGVQTTTGVFNIPPAISASEPLDLDKVIASLNNSMENFTSRGSGWLVDRVNYVRMTVGALCP
jgi:hypothetical protein